MAFVAHVLDVCRRTDRRWEGTSVADIFTMRKPPSASVHAGVKREKIPAAVDVRPRGDNHHPGVLQCLVGGYINSSWRRARLQEKRVKEGRDVLRRVPSARMFACYYCRQIPTSRAADAHYNCKRGPVRSGQLSLARRRVISECIEMCIRKCLDSASFEGRPSIPLIHFYRGDDAAAA